MNPADEMKFVRSCGIRARMPRRWACEHQVVEYRQSALTKLILGRSGSIDLRFAQQLYIGFDCLIGRSQFLRSEDEFLGKLQVSESKFDHAEHVQRIVGVRHQFEGLPV